LVIKIKIVEFDLPETIFRCTHEDNIFSAAAYSWQRNVLSTPMPLIVNQQKATCPGK
jgi:hypothetical protein